MALMETQSESTKRVQGMLALKLASSMLPGTILVEPQFLHSSVVVGIAFTSGVWLGLLIATNDRTGRFMILD